MKKHYSRGFTSVSLFYLIILVSLNVFSQVGIGNTDPHSSAFLDIGNGTDTNTLGLLIPRVEILNMTTAAPVTSPATGLLVYNTRTSTGTGFYYWNGSRWIGIDGGKNWQLSGNAGTLAGTDFLGTTDNVPLQFKTRNFSRFEITSGTSQTTGGRMRAFTNGTEEEPIYSWNSNIGTGMFQQADNVLGFSTNGTEKLRIPNANQVHAINNGTAALPFYSWSGNNGTGMFQAAANALAFSTAGSERIRILSSGQIAINRTTAIDGSTRLTVNESGSNRAIYGSSGSGEGIRGEATSGDGVVGLATTGRGIYGGSTATNSEGGFFTNTHNRGFGIIARGGTSTAYTFNNSGTGASITGRTYGITSFSAANNGTGLAGIGDNLAGLPVTPLGVGVVGFGNQAGVYGDSGYFGANGIHGSGSGNPFGTSYGTGVYGDNVGGLGDGVSGESTNIGIRGYGANGAILESNNNNGMGAVIVNTSASGDNRVGLAVSGQNGIISTLPGGGASLVGSLSGGSGWATSSNGTGTIGVGNNITTAQLGENGSGVSGTGSHLGVYGHGNNNSGTGVVGLGNDLSAYYLPADGNGAGVAGTGINTGVFGHATDPSGYGVYSSGDLHATGNITADGTVFAPRGMFMNGLALAEGNIAMIGTLNAQTIAASGDILANGVKNFIIDHPLDPENKYLKHASIESNEILNLYRGVATFDDEGRAVVHLPNYFEAININATYQLTPMGASMPNLFIAEKVNNGVFIISGGVAGKEVSWQVTSERNDSYIRNTPELRNMVADKGTDRGFYLAPEAYGQPRERGILNKRVNKMKTSLLSSHTIPTASPQLKQSKTAEAQLYELDEIQKITSPYEARRTQNMDSKELRSTPLNRAEQLTIEPKVKLQDISNNTPTALNSENNETLSEP